MNYDVIIVGAGHGGAQAAAMLRQLKFEGTIAIVGDEPELPYDRPPLSKEYFSGEKEFERLLLRPPEFWEERKITMHLNEHVIEVDPNSKKITTKEGNSFSYGKLIWATGGSPRTLPIVGGNLENVQGVRTKADADAMIRAATSSNNFVVIGGGYIGLEAAAVLAKAGKKVVVLEVLDRVLARVAGEQISRFYEAQHKSYGVDIQLNTKIDCIEGSTSATGVRLANGNVIPADFIIVGIGILPAVTPLLDAGALGDNGVDVDEFCQTVLSDIYAIGDCAAHKNKYAENTLIRLESVQNANDQARTVARHICDQETPYDAVPWFWSNQYDLKLQTIGLSIGHDQTVLRGDPETKSFSLVYLKAGKVIALDCVNLPKDYAQGRMLVMKGIVPDPKALANPDISLKDLASV